MRLGVVTVGCSVTFVRECVRLLVQLRVDVFQPHDIPLFSL